MARVPIRKKFGENPSSLRWATAASVTVTAILVLVGGVLMFLFDRDEYPTFGDALWFTLQTITTVGYGDETPVTAIGRVVASVVMLISIGLITVISALITSAFIESARSKRRALQHDGTVESLARIEAMLAATQARLDEIEGTQGPATDDAG